MKLRRQRTFSQKLPVRSKYSKHRSEFLGAVSEYEKISHTPRSDADVDIPASYTPGVVAGAALNPPDKRPGRLQHIEFGDSTLDYCSEFLGLLW